MSRWKLGGALLCTVVAAGLSAGLASAGHAADGATITGAYHGVGPDKAGPTERGVRQHPDGKPDYFASVTVTLDKPQTITHIGLNMACLSWSADHWFAVYRDGKLRNLPPFGEVKDAVSGTVVYELYGSGTVPGADITPACLAQGFSADVQYVDKLGGHDFSVPFSSKVVPFKAGAAPAGTATAASTGSAAPAAGAAAPDTKKKVPDFWAELSASVITKGTLGIGRDLALTAGATNNQVLTVVVHERATSCLVEGVWVELRDPSGAAVPRTRTQTQEGLAYLGGLKQLPAGLYHLWITAQDTAGKVVMEGYLPVKVVDRGSTPFITLNGRSFTPEGNTWTEGARVTQAAGRSAAGPADPFVTAFQQLLAGITSGLQSLFTPAQKTKAATATAILKGAKSPTAALLDVKSQTGIYPSFLVTGDLQAAEARAADVSPAKVKLVSHDGGSLVSHDGGSLVSHDGGSLVSHDGGSFVAAGGNIIAGSGPGNGRALAGAQAGASPRAAAPGGPCTDRYKTVGAGKTVMVDGSPVLAGKDGKLAPDTLVIGGRNAMPVSGYVG